MKCLGVIAVVPRKPAFCEVAHIRRWALYEPSDESDALKLEQARLLDISSTRAIWMPG